MADIYQIPESNGNAPQFTIPLGGNMGGFGFGNGMNGIADLFGLAIIASMVEADFWGSSIEDEEHMARYIKDVICDEDGYEGLVMCRFLADCSAKGNVIHWDRML